LVWQQRLAAWREQAGQLEQALGEARRAPAPRQAPAVALWHALAATRSAYRDGLTAAWQRSQAGAEASRAALRQALARQEAAGRVERRSRQQQAARAERAAAADREAWLAARLYSTCRAQK
jgi:hypothetical protein